MGARGRAADEVEPEVRGVERDGELVKLALGLADGAAVECVAIPMPTSDPARRRFTACLSTQVGCRMGCTFCATGAMGFRRDLTAGEIVGQVRCIERVLGVRPDNLVFMGMGEPLDNFDAWRESVKRLVDSRRVGTREPVAYSARDMTVSTCGHVPGLARLATEGFRKLGLAVSLNASNDEVRSRLMPVDRRWPLAALREALERLPLRNKIFLAEYVVFDGVNHAPEHARELADYLRGFRALVNLIAYNPVPGRRAGELRAPAPEAVARFCDELEANGVFARVRESKGRRIGAACGQLATCAASRGRPRAPRRPGSAPGACRRGSGG